MTIMTDSDDNFLAELAQEFQIAQNLPAEEHIKILKRLEKVKPNKLCLVLNYFLTLEKNKTVLAYIIKIISRCMNELTIDILSEMLVSSLDDTSDENTKLKCEIVNALGSSKNSSCVMSILYVLNNKNENYKIRLACAEALGRIGSSYAVTPLIDVVVDNEEKSIYLRESAAKALGMLGDMRAIEPLSNMLENKNGLFDKFTFLKERIIEALGKLGQYGDAKSIRALKSALEDESTCIRIGAIEALSEIENDEVIPIIESMLFDEDEEVCRSAVFALYEMFGQEYLNKILKKEDLNDWCKDEINSLITNEDEIGVLNKRDEE